MSFFTNSEMLGIDISSDNIKILICEKKRKDYKIRDIFTLPYPPEDKSRPRHSIISNSIRRTLQLNKIKTKKTFLTFSNKDIFYQHSVFPFMKKEDLIEAIVWMYRDQIDFDIGKATIEYSVIREFYENDLKNLELFITIIAQEEIDKIVEIVQDAGLTPLFLSFAPFACKEYCSRNMPLTNNEQLLWLELESNFAVLNIIKGNSIAFARVIRYDNDEFANILIESSLIDKLYSISLLSKTLSEQKEVGSNLKSEAFKKQNDKHITRLFIILATLSFLSAFVTSVVFKQVPLSSFFYLLTILLLLFNIMVILNTKNNIILYPKLKSLINGKKKILQKLEKHCISCGYQSMPDISELNRMASEVEAELVKVETSKTALLRSGGAAEIFVMEVIRTISYYREKYGLSDMNRVIISGSVADIIGIDDYLAKELSLDIEKIKLLDHYDVISDNQNTIEKNSSSFVKLVGLLMIDTASATNFLPTKIKEKLTLLKLIVPSSVLITSFCILLLLIVQLLDSNYKYKLELFNTSKKQLAALSPVKNKLVDIQNSNYTKSTQVIFMQEKADYNIKAIRLLVDISQSIPKHISIDEINFNPGTKDLSPTSNYTTQIKGTIRAASIATSELAEFISRLRQSPAIDQIDLIFLNKKEIENAEDQQKFELLCIITN